MTVLLTRKRLDLIRRHLLGRNVRATFYKVKTAEGEVEIGSITSGFNVVREKRGAGRDGQGVEMIVSKDAGIDRDDLAYGGVVKLTIDSTTTSYSIAELLPMQQLSAGYVLRLEPMTGATG